MPDSPESQAREVKVRAITRKNKNGAEGSAPEGSIVVRKLAYFHRRLFLLRIFQLAMHHAGVNLTRTGNFLLRVLDQLVPLRQPAGCARDGEQHGEHLRLEAHGLVDDSGVEIHVGIQLASDKVIVLERYALQFDGGIQLGVAASNLEHLLGDRLDDLGARIVVLVNSMPEAHQLELACLYPFDVGGDV